MAFVLITLTTTLILNLAVLTLLKIGLRDGQVDDWADRQPC